MNKCHFRIFDNDNHILDTWACYQSIHSFSKITVVRRPSAHEHLIGIFKSLGGWAFTWTLNKEGKKIDISQSLGVGFWTSMGSWTANYGKT